MDELEEWAARWAGGLSGLVKVALDVRSETNVRQRAANCLRLVAQDGPEALDQLPDNRVKADLAWLCVPSHWSLEYLSRSPEQHDLLLTPLESRSSRLAILLDHAELLANIPGPAAARDLEFCLDILMPTARRSSHPSCLAERLPPLIVTSRTRGSRRQMPLHVVDADRVVWSLLLRVDDIVAGRSTKHEVVELLKPWAACVDDPAITPKMAPRSLSLAAAASRALGGVDCSPKQPAITLHEAASRLTAADLIAAVAPALHASLASAPVPPLGIRPRAVAVSPDALNQASAWAGKVYSQHQFRTRDNVGLGITATAQVSRPASKHVDEYQKR